jgi:FMN phosphatase YigB (HAD superfamily)
LATNVSREALFCDIGGVLISDPWELTARKLGKEYGVDSAQAYSLMTEYSKLLDLGQLTLYGLWRRLSDSLATEISYSRFRRFFLDESFVRIPEVWDAVRWLRLSTGFSVFALSNMSEPAWTYLRERYDIGSLFDGVTLSCRCGIIKPDPRIFRLALKRARRGAHGSIFLDDSKENVATAMSIGLMAHRAGSPAATARFVRSLAMERGQH